MSRTTLWTATILISVTLCVIVAEATLRLSGRTPWAYSTFGSNEPTMHEFDPRLGWRAKQGSFLVPPWDPSGTEIRCTSDARGRRRTGAGKRPPGNEMVIVGGSFTQGWAISDEETFAWKLQERFPSLNVMNYGTGGYGTYQSLLVLENELPLLKSPVIVLYGYIVHHAARNIAPVSWLKVLSEFSRRGTVHVPYATVDEDGALVRHPPVAYLQLPFRGSSAAIALLEEVYMRTRVRTLKEGKARKVMERVLLAMAATSEEHGARFLVINFQPVRPVTKLLVKFLEVNQIEYVDCGFPFEGMTVPGEAHPNGDMNTLWSECIVDGLGVGPPGQR